MNIRLSDNVRHIGPFSIRQMKVFPDRLYIRHADGEGGSVDIDLFTREVGPWEEIGDKDAEKVTKFYGRNF